MERKKEKEWVVTTLKNIKSVYDGVDEYCEKLMKFGVNLYDTRLYEFLVKSNDIAIDSIVSRFTENEEDRSNLFDTIEWFFFEYLNRLKEEKKKPCKANAQMWDEDNTSLCYDFNSLADYIIDYNTK